MHVCAICATCGRHTLLERSLRFFLDQEHDTEKDHFDVFHLLIYNNSNVELSLDDNLFSKVEGYKSVQLVNNHIDSQTGLPYTNLGAIYNDALKHIPDNIEVIVHWDDDDIFLPNHLSEGVKGLERGNLVAYKPAKSYYRHPGGVELMSNTLEPSIFVASWHIMEHGYSLETTAQHLQWVNPLVYEKKIFVDENGPATLIYNWGDVEIPTFKTSGNPTNLGNFDNYRNFSRDHGDRVITPWKKEDVQKYYDLVYGQVTS